MKQHPEDQLKAELAELRSQLAAARGRLAELETTDVERESAEWRARVSARQWKATFDAISDPVFLMDAGGTIVRCNQALVDHLGRPRSAIIGRQCRELMDETTGSVEGCPYERALKTMQRATVEWQLGERWFEATVDPMLDDDGYLIGFVHILENITERKRADQARRRRNLELGLLHRAAQAFGSTLDLEKLLTTVLEEVRRALDVDGCSIWLSDPQTDELVCHGAAGLGSEIVQGWRLAPGEGFVGWVTARGRSLIVPDARDDERHFTGVDAETGMEIRSVLAVPLRVKDRVIGTLEAVDAEVGRLAPTDRRLLEPLAALAAIAIQNARLYEAAEAEIAERMRAEEALRESEQHYRVLFEHLPIPVFTKNRQGEYTSCNAANQRYWDVNPVGRTDAEILAPEVATALREADLRVMETGNVLTVEEYLPGTPLGDRQVLTRKASLRDSRGNTVGILGASIDITERKQAEKALRESQERFKSLVETMNDGLSLLDETGNFSYVNDRFCEMLGYSRDELIGSHHLGVVADEYWERHKKILGERMEGKSEVYETVFKRKDGERVPVILAGSPLFDQDGNYRGAIGAATDITERKRAEEALRDSEERYRSLFEKTPIGLYRTTPDGTILEANPALVNVLGYGDRDSMLAASALDLYVDPDDRSRGLRQLDAADEWAGVELRLRRRDGRIIWVLDTGRATRDDDGRIRYYDGALQDITERRRAEEALRRRAEELAALQATVLDITARHDLPTLLQTIVAHAVELLNGRAGGMYLCDPDREEARCVVSYNTPVDFTGRVLRYGEGAAGTVAQTGEPLIIDDYRAWSGRAAVYEEEQPFTAVLSAPMMWQGQVTGVIHVLHDVETRRFTEAELELLTLFASHAAIAVENARLLEQARKEIAERVQAEEALRKSEEKYRLTSENMPVVVYSALPDEHSTSVFLSGRAEELTGYSVEEFLADPNLWPSIVHQEDEDFVWERINDHRRDKTTLDVEYRIMTRDGVTKWIRDKARPALDENGEIVRIDGFMEDITEHKQAEEALRASEERLRSFMESASDSFYLLDSDLHFVQVNRRGLNVIGKPEEEVIGKDIRDIVPDVVDSGRYEEHLKVLKTGRPFAIGDFIPHPVFGDLHFILKSFKVGDGLGVIATDITELKRTERALRESERQKELILDSTAEMVAYYDTDLRVIWANRAAGESVGRSPEELVGLHCYEIWHGIAEPCANCPVLEARDARAPRQGERQTPDGSHWLVRGYPVLDAEDSVVALVEFTQDVTERKQAEEALKEKMQHVQRVNELFLGREQRVLDLKREVNALLEKLGQPPGYESPSQVDALRPDLEE
jgi:PAS domain S-box-containing protein